MIDLIDSDCLFVLAFENAKIRFGAPGRPYDEKHHYIFAVQLPNRPLLYGEWRPKWASNENEFDAEIIDFGLVDPRSAGSLFPQDRKAFSRPECRVIEDLVRRLFASIEGRSGIIPFSVRGSNFLGRVDFLPGWIREE